MKEAIRRELQHRYLNNVRPNWSMLIICILCNDDCSSAHYKLWVNGDVIFLCESCPIEKSDDDLTNDIFFGYFRDIMEIK